MDENTTVTLTADQVSYITELLSGRRNPHAREVLSKLLATTVDEDADTQVVLLKHPTFGRRTRGSHDTLPVPFESFADLVSGDRARSRRAVRLGEVQRFWYSFDD